MERMKRLIYAALAFFFFIIMVSSVWIGSALSMILDTYWHQTIGVSCGLTVVSSFIAMFACTLKAIFD